MRTGRSQVGSSHIVDQTLRYDIRTVRLAAYTSTQRPFHSHHSRRLHSTRPTDRPSLTLGLRQTANQSIRPPVKQFQTRNAWQSPAFSPPGANAPAKLRGYWTKFTKFLSDTEESSVALTRASMLRSSHPLWNASAQNEGGVCQFSPIRVINRFFI